MLAKKSLVCILLIALCAGCGGGQKERMRCKTQESCVKDSNCNCWCSQICGYRKKNQFDKPVYVENDPNGKSCYCKQWDIDHYEDNCILGKKVLEPKSAQ